MVGAEISRGAEIMFLAAAGQAPPRVAGSARKAGEAGGIAGGIVAQLLFIGDFSGIIASDKLTESIDEKGGG